MRHHVPNAILNVCVREGQLIVMHGSANGVTVTMSLNSMTKPLHLALRCRCTSLKPTCIEDLNSKLQWSAVVM